MEGMESILTTVGFFVDNQIQTADSLKNKRSFCVAFLELFLFLILLTFYKAGDIR